MVRLFAILLLSLCYVSTSDAQIRLDSIFSSCEYLTEENLPDSSYASITFDQYLPDSDSICIRCKLVHGLEGTFILDFGALQDVKMRSGSGETTVGTVLPMRYNPTAGYILSGIGATAHVQLEAPFRDDYLYFDIVSHIEESAKWRPEVWHMNEWHTHCLEKRSEVLVIQSMVIGAMLLITLYHFLIFLYRRDRVLFYYSLYTFVVAIVIAIDTGVAQVWWWTDHQLAYRLIWETQIFSMIASILYFLFMRSFVNLAELVPWLDRFIRNYLIVYLPLALMIDIYYISTGDSTIFNVLFPLSILCLGIFCVVTIIRTGDTLARYFVVGTLILYLCTLITTLLSLAESNGWIAPLAFPRAWVTEVGIIIELVIFALGIGWRMRREDVKRANELADLRVRISSDLHDDVGSMLTGLSMQANVMSYRVDGALKAELKQISEKGRMALDTMRDHVWAIDSRKDTYMGLIDKMKDFALMNVPEEISYHIQVTGVDEASFIHPDARQQIYLIYKEALTNAIKHSTGDNINIDIHRNETQLSLTIRDNGDIADLPDTRSGLGISNMKMRAQRINGDLTVNFDQGCEVKLIVQKK